MKLTVRLGRVTSQNWAEGLLIPAAVAERLWEEVPDKRYVFTVNEDHRMRGSILKAGGEYFAYLSREKRRAWGIDFGDEVRLEITPDGSEYGIELPEEWAEMMALDPDTDRRFRALSPGRQRNLLHRIGSAKREATRIRRALMIADYLREHGTRFDYRELAEYAKGWNADHPD